ncbi:MAG: copper amine oxidase N-terminal domain-containing protein [Anaerotignum sp.]|nr:copper amine oxidase N-terminal domain-containing protein [Anaerotignum sp.]
MALGTCPVSAEDGTREISAAFRDIKIIVDGKQLSTPAEPFIYNGTTYLPVRAVGEAVGKEVAWDNDTKTVTLMTPPPTIEADRDTIVNLDFKLSVTPSGKKERTEILRVNEKYENGSSSYSLYYYGLSDVSITIDGQTLPLAQALQEGKLTPQDILQKGWQDVENKEIWGDSYRDGGSVCFIYKDFTIIKFHTLDGLRDLYIGIPEMELNALEDQYYPYSRYISIEEVIKHYTYFVTSTKNDPELKDDLFEEGLAILQEVAKRDHVSDEELQAAVRKYQEMCGR